MTIALSANPCALSMNPLSSSEPRLPVSVLRLLRRARLSAWRQSLPVIPDPAQEEADRHALSCLRAARTQVEIEGKPYLLAKDGTYQPLEADAFKGAFAVSAGAALGLTQTHAALNVSQGLVTLTLIQPPRKEEQSIRADVMHALLSTGTDADFDAVARKRRARKAEKQLAQRVTALRHVGTKTADDREVRERVGVQVREIRSV